jgi:hypothetical protein
MKNNVELISPELFADPGTKVYAVLDGASVAGLIGKLYQWRPKYECLYRGELAPDLAEVAPYLVHLESETEFCDWVLNQGWGNHWGIFALSVGDLFTLRQHFRRFLTVHDSTGKPLLFRYYDPRVMRTYLPTCNPQEVTAIFGPVSLFMMESEDPGVLLAYGYKSGSLVAKKKQLSEIQNSQRAMK